MPPTAGAPPRKILEQLFEGVDVEPADARVSYAEMAAWVKRKLAARDRAERQRPAAGAPASPAAAAAAASSPAAASSSSPHDAALSRAAAEGEADHFAPLSPRAASLRGGPAFGRLQARSSS